MPIKNWSTTAAQNNSSPPNGAPEGMAPSTVNDIFRQQMADHKTQWLDAEWFDRGDSGLSRASASSFKITGDVTGEYLAGRRVKCYDATTLYASIASSSYSAPDTTVNVTMDSGTLTTSLSSIALSILRPTNTAIPTASTLSVAGTSSLSGAVTLKTSLNVEGSTTLSGTVTVRGITTIESATTLKSSLNIEGATTLSGAVTIRGITTHEAATILKTSLNVEGPTSLSGVAILKGATTLESTVTISGAATLKTSLNVEGPSTLSGAVVCKSTLTVNGVAVTGSGDWTKIATATASSSASLEFTGLTSAYIAYVAIIERLFPSSDAADLILRTSSNNGSSYDSGAGNYKYVINTMTSGSNTPAGSAGATGITFVDNVGNASGEGANGMVYIYNPSSATECYMNSYITASNGSGTLYIVTGCGTRESAADVDAIQFTFAPGSITSGSITLYGVKA